MPDISLFSIDKASQLFISYLVIFYCAYIISKEFTIHCVPIYAASIALELMSLIVNLYRYAGPCQSTVVEHCLEPTC